MTRFVALILTGFMAATVFGFTGVAVAQVDPPAPDTGTGGLVLLSRSVETTDSFELGIQLPGVVRDDDILILAVHRRVADRTEFRETIAGRLRGDPLAGRRWAISELSVTARGGVSLEFSSSTVIQELREPGVYPVSVELRTTDQRRLGRLITHLVRVVDPIPAPTVVAFALIMDVRPEETATREIVATDTTAQWMKILIDRPDLPVTVQITPFLFDWFQADPVMRTFIERLKDAEIIAAPYVPFDERTLEFAGLDQAATALFARGVATLKTVLESDPITTRWLTRSEPDRDNAVLWHRRGVRDVVVSVDREDLDGPIEIVTDEGTLRTLVAPGWFTDADPNDTVLGAHHLLAELAVIAMTSEDDTSSVLLFGTGTPLNQRFMDELIGGLTASAVIRPVSLSEAVAVPQMVDAIGQPIELDAARAPYEELSGDVQLYLDAVSTLESYRSMIQDEDTHLVYDDVRDQLLVSLGAGITGTVRDAEARRAKDKVRAEIAAIEPPPLGGVSLTSREATAPFSFRNTNDYPMRIEVRFISDKALFVDFDDGETTTIVLEPGITTKEFRVQALSAGSFPLRIEMFSPDGALELGGVDLTIRSTVPSFVGVALTIGAILVLVIWWARSLLRSRRRVAG